MPTSQEQRPVIIVLGGQYGSEGKGEVVGRLVQEYGKAGAVSVVRTGGPQAGHSITFPGGKKISVCQIPCGFHVPNALMYTGPVSEVDPDRLASELAMLSEAGFEVEDRYTLDPRATVLEHEDKDMEAGSGMTARLGSTAKGIGACRVRRTLRTAKTVRQYADHNVGSDIDVLCGSNCPGEVDYLCGGANPLVINPYKGQVVIETAQGYGLGLHMAGCYPFCTSTDITPGRAMSDAGLSSRIPHKVVMVIRTFPIRVHGNSGPMYKELSWEELHAISKGRSPMQGELTTVTKKVRRISQFDWPLFKAACESCTPDALVITFMDYLVPELADVTSWDKVYCNQVARMFIEDVEMFSGCSVVAVGTGAGVFATKPGNWPVV